MSGFLRDLAGKRSEGLIGPEDPCGGVGHSFPLAGIRCAVCGVERDDLPPAPLPPTRHDPAVGDLVVWHDGSVGEVAHVRESWIDPGEAVVYRDRHQAHPGAPSWMVEAGSLVADRADETGRVIFTYRGSLR